MSAIEKNWNAVRARVNEAACRAMRSPESVTLIAVSKRKPAEDIRRAYDAGCREFGENYAQELLEKAAELAELQLRIHHIGHLQTNKVRALVGKVALFHAVDREALVTELDVRAQAAGVRAEILLQVNVADEQTKSGCQPMALGALLAHASSCRAVDVCGLMTMPPAVSDPNEARGWFRELRRLRDDLGDPRLRELSMGMSHDFEVAIEEGATMVRVGSAIFGERS